jgi:hypothetical protein
MSHPHNSVTDFRGSVPVVSIVHEHRVSIQLAPPMNAAITPRIESKSPHVLFDFSDGWRLAVMPVITSFSQVEQVRKSADPLPFNVFPRVVAAFCEKDTPNWETRFEFPVYPAVNGGVTTVTLAPLMPFESSFMGAKCFPDVPNFSVSS